MLLYLFGVLIILLILLKFRNKTHDIVPVPIPTPQNKPLMFGRLSCPYTVKMLDLLKKENAMRYFKYVDTETKQGSSLFDSYGGKGVPYFVSANGRAAGFMPLSKLFQKLNI